MKRKGSPFLLAAVMLSLGSSAEAVNFLANCAVNGITLGSDLIIGYDNLSTPLIPVPIPPPCPLCDVVRSTPPTALIVWSVAPAAAVTAGPIARAPVLGGIAIKDQVMGEVRNEFRYGYPGGTVPGVPRDRFRLRAFGSGSAMTAQEAAGAPADAYVEAHATVDFFNDMTPTPTPLPAPLNCAGAIFLPPLRALAPFETLLAIDVFMNPGGGGPPIHTQTAGSPGVTLPLAAGAFYRLVLNYKLRVPHGTDPPFDLDIEIDIKEALPTPSLSPFGLALVVLGVFALGGGILLRGRAMIR